MHFTSIFSELKYDIEDLAKKTFADNKKEAEKDGKRILDVLKTQLQRYATGLANGDLTSKEFKDLLFGQKAEIEMVALKRAGISLVEADKFKSEVFNAIVTTVLERV